MKVCAVILFASFAIFGRGRAAEEVSPGRCPPLQSQTNFNQTLFEGTWYETRRFVNTLISGDCTTANYKWWTTYYNVTYSTKDIKDSANIVSSEVELQLNNKIPPTAGQYNVYVNNIKQPGDLNVLGTDYTTYAIVWGCRLINGTNNTQQLFIYSRQRTLNEERYANITATLNNLSINTTKWVTVEQDEKKCNSGALVYPSIISGLIALLVTKMFQ